MQDEKNPNDNEVPVASSTSSSDACPTREIMPKRVRYVVPFTGRFTVSGTAIGAKTFNRRALLGAVIGILVLIGAAIFSIYSAKQVIVIKHARSEVRPADHISQ
jgi:hypothetical protein